MGVDCVLPVGLSCLMIYCRSFIFIILQVFGNLWGWFYQLSQNQRDSPKGVSLLCAQRSYDSYHISCMEELKLWHLMNLLPLFYVTLPPLLTRSKLNYRFWIAKPGKCFQWMVGYLHGRKWIGLCSLQFGLLSVDDVATERAALYHYLQNHSDVLRRQIALRRFQAMYQVLLKHLMIT